MIDEQTQTTASASTMPSFPLSRSNLVLCISAANAWEIFGSVIHHSSLSVSEFSSVLEIAPRKKVRPHGERSESEKDPMPWRDPKAAIARA